MDGGAWWAAVHEVAKSRTWLSNFTRTFHFHALKEMATHSSVLAWRIPGTEEPGRRPSMGSQRVRHDWSNLAAAAELYIQMTFKLLYSVLTLKLSLSKCSVDYPPQTWSSSAISSHKMSSFVQLFRKKTCSYVLLYHIWYWWSLISFVFQNIIWIYPFLPLPTITILVYDTFITYLDYCFLTGPPASTLVYHSLFYTQQWGQFMLVISLLKSSTVLKPIFFHTYKILWICSLAALFLAPISPIYSLGSSTMAFMLFLTHSSLFFPCRAFTLAVPSTWNDLP